MENQTITEKQINLIKKRLNSGRPDAEESVLGKDYEYPFLITPEQTKKGLEWLRNQWKTPRGVERKTNPFGWREQDAIENFQYFELTGFYDAGNSYNSFYVPVYAVIGKDSSFEYVLQAGKVLVIG